MQSNQKLSRTYLWLVPIASAAIGFGVGPVSYKIYLPVWGLNTCLMIFAAWHLSAQKLLLKNCSGRQELITGLLLFAPWVLFAIFAGMGPPPTTVQSWANTAAEQQIRYTILMAGGILLFLGTAQLKMQLRARGESLYSTLAFATISLAIPLFMINMAFWGYYLTDAFQIFATNPTAKRPDWYVPIKSLFYVISVAEVALFYLGTCLFSVSLKSTGLINRTAFRWYFCCSILAALLVLTPPSWPEPFATAGYLVAVPAIPFIMYYIIGVQLLKTSGKIKNHDGTN